MKEGAEDRGSFRREQERRQVGGGMKRLKDNNSNPGLEGEGREQGMKRGN